MGLEAESRRRARKFSHVVAFGVFTPDVDHLDTSSVQAMWPELI